MEVVRLSDLCCDANPSEMTIEKETCLDGSRSECELANQKGCLQSLRDLIIHRKKN